MKTMWSNYDNVEKQMQDEFLKYDLKQIAQRFGLSIDDDYLYLRFLGSDCRIDIKTGAVECSHFGEFRAADYNEAMTVYDLLCYSEPDAAPSGQYVNMRSLSGILSAASAPDSQKFYKKGKNRFDHKEKALARALEQVGGKAAGDGDVSAVIEVFNGLNMVFRFWNSDEDFEPDIQFLWDRNVLKYMHYETVWFVNSALLARINEYFEE
ncbi:MAG: DUF3786 domain-containing protein [Oscillospiraceae bacterium]|nr:DUF3786 domain-containing protein [Oscillospiraceae bacterium]